MFVFSKQCVLFRNQIVLIRAQFTMAVLLPSLLKWPCRRGKALRDVYIPRRTFWMWLNFVFNRYNEDKRFVNYWVVSFRVDHSRVADVGPDRAAGEWILRLGGSVKFTSYESWTTDYNRMPAEPREKMRLEAINASGISITNNGLEHLDGLERLNHLNISNCKYVSDDGLLHLNTVRDTLQDLDLSYCPSITHRGLPSLYTLHRLQWLNLRETPGIRDREEMIASLHKAIPHCDITQ